MGVITLEEIKTLVHNKGYFLLNESILVADKVKILREKGYKLLEEEGFSNDVCRFFYKNNLFTLDDLMIYGKKVFYLKEFGPIRKRELEQFLQKSDIVLDEEDATMILKNCQRCMEKESDFNYNILKAVSVEEIGDLFAELRNKLINSGILTLYQLINTDYNELKDMLCSINDIELIELVSFLNNYGLKIKGYDQTNYNSRAIIKETDTFEIESDKIKEIKIENLDIEVRIEKKQELIDKYKEVMIRRQMLLEQEEALDLEISNILAQMEEVSNYERSKTK